MTYLHGHAAYFFKREAQYLGESLRHEPLTPQLGVYLVEYLALDLSFPSLGENGLPIDCPRAR